MNWTNLFKMQAELDEYIGKSKGINMADYKTERVLALLVEFGELVNELRFLFKYWSNKEWEREKALEEYVDGLHFILSIGNDHGFTRCKPRKLNEHVDMKLYVFGITNIISRIGMDLLYGRELAKVDYDSLFHHYILFGKKLGFHKNEIITHYELKHAENYNRQANGY